MQTNEGLQLQNGLRILLKLLSDSAMGQPQPGPSTSTPSRQVSGLGSGLGLGRGVGRVAQQPMIGGFGYGIAGPPRCMKVAEELLPLARAGMKMKRPPVTRVARMGSGGLSTAARRGMTMGKRDELTRLIRTRKKENEMKAKVSPAKAKVINSISGKGQKWGKDANKTVLDKELDEYMEERRKANLSKNSLDTELERYQAVTAKLRQQHNNNPPTPPGDDDDMEVF